jgi:hypothetical protein
MSFIGGKNIFEVGGEFFTLVDLHLRGIEAFDKDEKSELLYDGQGVRNPPRPKGFPDFIDLVF